jgi:hypothetical protein
MNPVARKILEKVAFVLVAILVCPLSGVAANGFGAIAGQVQDSTGVSVVGALVVVSASEPSIQERLTFTDQRGSFAVSNLLAGAYSVRITMPRFLPVLKRGIYLSAGTSAVLTVNLQSAIDVFRRVAQDKDHAEDIVWTLRSARSTQPVLRFAEARPQETTGSFEIPEYSGYFQVYSKSVQTSSGVTEGVGSNFSVTMPFEAGSQVTVAGQYNEIPTQPRGFGALYEFKPMERHRASIGLKVRQSALLADPLQSESLREVRLEYGEDFQWSDSVVFNYGAEVGRVDAISDRNYLRPRFGLSWIPGQRVKLSAEVTSQAPAAADDPIRGKEYFDRTLYVPPALERYAHTEATLSRLLSDNMEIYASAFRDQTDSQAMFVSYADGRQGVLLLDTRRSPSQGVRLHLNRRFRGFEAGLGYTAASGLGIGTPAKGSDQVTEQLVRRRFHVVTARFKADVDTTWTEITAIYRWMSGFAATHVDPYQRLAEYNDPTLSLTIAQNLPTWRMFPGKVQAILDARNLFEQSFGPSGAQVAYYPRLVKGGINIKF